MNVFHILLSFSWSWRQVHKTTLMGCPRLGYPTSLCYFHPLKKHLKSHRLVEYRFVWTSWRVVAG